MNENLELVQKLYKDAEMGVYTCERLLEDLKEKDNKIKQAIEDILKQYHEFKQQSEKILNEKQIEMPENGMLSKMGARMGIKKEVKQDNSDSAIAAMLIEGISMGSLDTKKNIDQYKDHMTKEEKKLLNHFLKFQEDSIEKLKKFL